MITTIINIAGGVGCFAMAIKEAISIIQANKPIKEIDTWRWASKTNNYYTLTLFYQEIKCIAKRKTASCRNQHREKAFLLLKQMKTLNPKMREYLFNMIGEEEKESE